jgi:hypothetical protein
MGRMTANAGKSISGKMDVKDTMSTALVGPDMRDMRRMRIITNVCIGAAAFILKYLPLMMMKIPVAQR